MASLRVTNWFHEVESDLDAARHHSARAVPAVLVRSAFTLGRIAEALDGSEDLAQYRGSWNRAVVAFNELAEHVGIEYRVHPIR
jgi:hypothetical protein